MNKDDAIRSLNKLNPYIKEIVSSLKIVLPPFFFCDLLLQCSDGSIMGQNYFDPSNIPVNAMPIGAFFDEKENRVLLSLRLGHGFSTQIQADYMTTAEYLYIMAHELRHIWQRQYHYSEFFSINSIGLANLHDPSEIDADGFAIAFVFSEKIGFKKQDFPLLLEEITGQCMYDGGKRIQQAKKLTEEYSLGNNSFYDKL